MERRPSDVEAGPVGNEADVLLAGGRLQDVEFVSGEHVDSVFHRATLRELMRRAALWASLYPVTLFQRSASCSVAVRLREAALSVATLERSAMAFPCRVGGRHWSEE